MAFGEGAINIDRKHIKAAVIDTEDAEHSAKVFWPLIVVITVIISAILASQFWRGGTI